MRRTPGKQCLALLIADNYRDCVLIGLLHMSIVAELKQYLKYRMFGVTVKHMLPLALVTLMNMQSAGRDLAR